jgi:hypothetical protein
MQLNTIIKQYTGFYIFVIWNAIFVLKTLAIETHL